MSRNISSIFARRKAFAAIALAIVAIPSGRAAATTLYATSISGSQIDVVNTATTSYALYLNTPSAADSIMFDTSQRVIYDQLYTGQVRRYDPSAATDVLIAAGFNNPADMVLEPGGNSMLVSEYAGGNIDRINLNTNAVTTLSSPGGNPEGLAYDGTRLFANLGLRAGGPTGKFLAEIDPITGAILAQTPGLDSLDGLTYDPYSGRLYASSLFGNFIYSINPNNLNDIQDVTSHLGIIPAPDGITTDGLGNIFIASSDSLGDSHVYQLNLIANTLTQNVLVPGLDDLAPASGLGAAPEPSSIVLAAFGLIGAAGVVVRRRRTNCRTG